VQLLTPPHPVAVASGGGATSGTLDLSGLPPGQYRLALLVDTPDSQLVREAPFGMAGFESERPPVAAAEPAPVTDSLSAKSEVQLDSMYAPLVYLMRGEERGTYSGLTVNGKRAYLRQFWAQRDKTPGTPRNEFEELFYKTVAEANRRFREGGAAGTPGWRTDRGRIFILYGPPEEALDRSQAGSTRPYIVWKYTREKPRRFIFLSMTSLAHYELIYSDERREPTRANWQELLGAEAVQDALRF